MSELQRLIAGLQWDAHQFHRSEGRERATWCRPCRLGLVRPEGIEPPTNRV